MSYYTLIGKTVHCERWDLNITLTAKYRLCNDPNKPYEAHFSYATCPLVENCKITPDKQAEEYKYMICAYEHECPLLSDFKPVVDVRKSNC